MEVRERIIGAVTVMNDSDVAHIWELIQRQFNTPLIEMVNINSDDVTPEEKAIIEAYRRGDEEYQPYITLEEFTKEMGLA